MSKPKATVPGKETVLNILRGIAVPNPWDSGTTPETKRLDAAAQRRLAILMKDPTYRELQKKASLLRRKNKRASDARRKKKENLVNRIRLRGVTPQIVAEVEKMLGLQRGDGGY